MNMGGPHAPEMHPTPDVKLAAVIVSDGMLDIVRKLLPKGTPTVYDRRRALAVETVLRWAVKELLKSKA
jgi:hypothetical protein